MKLSFVLSFLLVVSFGGCYQSSVDSVKLYVTDEEARVLDDTLNDIPPPDAVIPHDVEPVAIRMLKPDYPPVALRQELTGNVALKVWVTTGGTVRRAVILKSPDQLFNKPALRAAMGWYFSPASHDRKTVACWTTIIMGFHTSRTQDVDIIR